MVTFSKKQLHERLDALYALEKSVVLKDALRVDLAAFCLKLKQHARM